MNFRPSLLCAALIALAAVAPVTVQEALTLDSIFVERDYAAARFGPARWLDGDSYATLEPSPEIPRANELVRYAAADGERVRIVSARELIPDFRDRPLFIEDYSFSADGRLLLIFTNSERVWRTNSRGDFWIFDLETRDLRQLGGSARESELMFAKFAPDSTRVAYVRNNDLYMEDLRTDVITRLTHDGSDKVVNGTFDWVYEEEFGLRDGFRWSPDGRRIAFWQLDTELVSEFVLVNYTAELYPQLTRFPYPKAGEINPAARIGTIAAGGGEITWAAFQGSPRDFYLARMEWASPNELIVQRVNRRQNGNDVMRVAAASGETDRLFLEEDEAWVDVRDDLHWIELGESFTWVSERDGWRRAYRIDGAGANQRPLSPPGVDILSIEAVDPVSGWLYYIASPDDPGQRYLFRVALDPGSNEIAPQRLTPEDQPGTHSYQVAPGGRWAIHTVSRFASPQVTTVVSLPDHKVTTMLVDNADLAARVAGLNIRHEFFRVEIEPGVELDAWAMYPADFDVARKYPVLFFVYGEPAGQTVRDAWGGSRALWHQYLTGLGYVVMSVDNRGTPAPRGRDWRKVVYGDVGTLAAADQAAAVRAIAARHDWVDLDRIAIWGWSGGGSMTLNAMFRYPELYQTGMSVAPVPDQRYYDTIYQERYMDTPQNNPDGYHRASPISHAQNLAGNLLIVHGTGDDNVHYQGTEALINKLITHNKHFTMMAYPNRSHGISEGTGTTRHLYGLLTRYLLENTPADHGGRKGMIEANSGEEYAQ